MAITFACTCGKKLQAREEFAGRKMKCPKCGTVLQIPEAAPPAAKRASHPTPPPLAKKPTPMFIEQVTEVIQVEEVAVVTVAQERPAQRAAVTARPRQIPNPWVDHSLDQQATPWPADAPEAGRPERADPRDQDRWWLTIVGLVLIVVGVIALWLLRPQINTG